MARKEKAAIEQSHARHHELIIDLCQLRENARILQQLMKPARICAILKNNAYGHGLIPCAEAIATTGITDFGVVENNEARQIRAANNDTLRSARLWRIRPALPWEYREAVEHNWQVIEQVGSLKEVGKFQNESASSKVVITLDCSMGREGFGVPSNVDDLKKAIAILGKNRIAGFMTHLANADGNQSALQNTMKELDDFDAAITSVRTMISDNSIFHVGNSAAGLRLERVRNYDMIRCGASLFGEVTSPLIDKPAELVSCLTWRTWIAQVRELPAGARVGYGSKYLATQKELVATLPIGYADGLKRSLGNGNGEVLVRGTKCPIRGNISSSSTVIGITHVPGKSIEPGEEVVIIGNQDNANQNPDELATSANTGHLDIQTGIRAPISYTKD